MLYFASEEGITRLVADTGRYWMDPTLNELEERLANRPFLRISRAALMNLSRRRFRELLAALEGK